MLQAFDHIGAIELFLESWCLLLWRIRVSPLPDSCDCRTRATSTPVLEVHEEHGVNHSLSLSQLPPDMFPMIDALTQADAQVYRVGVRTLLTGLREAERASGIPLLCNTTLTRFTNEVRYIPGLEADILSMTRGWIPNYLGPQRDNATTM